MFCKKSRPNRGAQRVAVVLSVCSILLFPARTCLAADDDDLFEMSIEDLLSIQVTSVSKKERDQSASPAAIFVITNEDLRRSGVTSIPEALRMVPGMNVARIDSNKWAVSSRGFNGRFANKLLVLIDGRSIYSNTFSGVYWEEQSVFLEDVERIEVVRGPGGTLWGANAVNGVINIITKRADDTRGGLVTTSVGDEERGRLGVRYGASLGDKTDGRAYIESFQRDEFVHTTGGGANDDWQMVRAGFRLDSELGTNDHVVVQGDIYKGEIDQALALASLAPPFRQVFDDRVETSGGNVLGRWQRTRSPTSEFALQMYVDKIDREEAFGHQKIDTFDLDFQHQFAVGKRHDIVWGFGYRHLEDNNAGKLVLTITPRKRSDQLYNVFIQDEINLVEDRLWLTLGSKFENNDYSGTEFQPSAQVLWVPNESHKFWVSAAKVVRTPSRLDHDFTVLARVIPPTEITNPFGFPIAMTLVGDPNVGPEELSAWEFGYRTNLWSGTSVDISAFYNDYDNVRSVDRDAIVPMGTYALQPLRFNNELSATSHGVELSFVWQAAQNWRWDLAYSYLEMDFDLRDDFDAMANAVSPRHQLSLRSNIAINKRLDFDLWLRYVDDSAATDLSILALHQIDNYMTLDVRIAWRPQENVEFSLVAQNLFDSQHLEFVQETFTSPTEVERSIYGKLTWSF